MRRPPPGLQSRGEGLTTEEETDFPMDTQNPSVPPHAQSALGGSQSHARATRRPRSGPDARRRPSGGISHDNTRHTTRFTVIGNHLTQHQELSLLAIGLGCHIQSLPAGARADIKTLAARFPEGATRIAAALRELEAHGYLSRERERTPAGRIITRTTSCNQPHAPPGSTRTPPPRRRPHRPRPAGARPPTHFASSPAPFLPYRTRHTPPRPSSTRPPASSQTSSTTTPASSSPPATSPTSPPASPPGWNATWPRTPYATPSPTTCHPRAHAARPR